MPVEIIFFCEQRTTQVTLETTRHPVSVTNMSRDLTKALTRNPTLFACPETSGHAVQGEDATFNVV